MKIKTLKDLKEEYQTYAETYSMDEFELKVKQEVIKLVKNCEICSTAQPIPICSQHRELAKFNNVIEEDLLSNNELNAREHGEIGNN